MFAKATAVLLAIGLAANGVTAQAGGDGHMNQAGLSMLEQFEGFVANFKDDGAGHKSIGFGHNCDAQPCAGIAAPISKAQAQTLLQKDIGQFETCTCALQGAGSMNTNQFSAMVVGTGCSFRLYLIT